MTKSILEIITSLWDTFSESFGSVYNTLSTPLSDLVNINVPVVSDILSWIVDVAKIGDYTVITFMFGVGLPLLIGLTVLKWFIDILP